MSNELDNTRNLIERIRVAKGFDPKVLEQLAKNMFGVCRYRYLDPVELDEILFVLATTPTHKGTK
jgi:hypothetical protein